MTLLRSLENERALEGAIVRLNVPFVENNTPYLQTLQVLTVGAPHLLRSFALLVHQAANSLALLYGFQQVDSYDEATSQVSHGAARPSLVFAYLSSCGRVPIKCDGALMRLIGLCKRERVPLVLSYFGRVDEALVAEVKHLNVSLIEFTTCAATDKDFITEVVERVAANLIPKDHMSVAVLDDLAPKILTMPRRAARRCGSSEAA
jgi:hypothetical protein